MALKIRDIDESQAPLLDHLIELRARLMRCVIALGLAFALCMYFARDIFAILVHPLAEAFPPGQGKLVYTELYGAFFVEVKVALFAAFFISFPVIANQLWAFVAPGLYQHEKRLVVPLIFSSTLLFFVGMAFAYFVVFPMAFRFFADFTPVGVTMATDIDKYFSFVLTMFVVFGIAFEVPVVEVLLVKIGAVTVEQLRQDKDCCNICAAAAEG